MAVYTQNVSVNQNDYSKVLNGRAVFTCSEVCYLRSSEDAKELAKITTSAIKSVALSNPMLIGWQVYVSSSAVQLAGESDDVWTCTCTRQISGEFADKSYLEFLSQQIPPASIAFGLYQQFGVIYEKRCLNINWSQLATDIVVNIPYPMSGTMDMNTFAVTDIQYSPTEYNINTSVGLLALCKGWLEMVKTNIDSHAGGNAFNYECELNEVFDAPSGY